MRYIILLLLVVLTFSGCESAQRNKEHEAGLEYYSYTYSIKRNEYGLKHTDSKDKLAMRKLERDGWVAIREDRDTSGDTDTITVYYER